MMNRYANALHTNSSPKFGHASICRNCGVHVNFIDENCVEFKYILKNLREKGRARKYEYVINENTEIALKVLRDSKTSEIIVRALKATGSFKNPNLMGVESPWGHMDVALKLIAYELACPNDVNGFCRDSNNKLLDCDLCKYSNDKRLDPWSCRKNFRTFELKNNVNEKI